ncbi:MAG TPA: 3-oxoacyl-ACP reductase FabG [Candidatus Mediterraneibacter merdipullorum]|nr:3-oxoacyl-ACP reductase FabG [Candidatus Mediterraneibacter merdipullorum]
MKKKNILVTGSSRGIGRACALAFARGGHHLFLNGRTPSGALEETARDVAAAGGTYTMLPGDVSDPDQVRGMFRQITSCCGGLDILVNNAGCACFGLLSDMTDAQWRQVLDTDLSSAFYCCREAIPNMVAQKRGKIINISSMWGTSGASCETAYSAAKSGLNGLTRALAKELAPSNIQVNALACGVIDTEMNARLSAEERAALEDEIPAGRYGTVDEVASAVLLLADAPSYLTGQVIGLDGGML